MDCEIKDAFKDNDRLYQKLIKLKELALRGIDGEANNARRIIASHLYEYGFELDDFLKSKEEIKEWWVSYGSSFERKLIVQCAAKLFGSKEGSPYSRGIWKYRDGCMKLKVHMTDLEYVQFIDFYNFHKEELKKKLEEQSRIIYNAYLKINDLYSNDDDDNESLKPLKPLTEKELFEILSAIAMAKSMEPSEYYKRIK